jgi:hypothetical protein
MLPFIWHTMRVLKAEYVYILYLAKRIALENICSCCQHLTESEFLYIIVAVKAVFPYFFMSFLILLDDVK